MTLSYKQFSFLACAHKYGPVALLLLWTAVLMVINHDWYFTPVSFVDPAIYIGWFLHPQLYRELFPLAHAGDLFPLILPNALAYHFFGPVVGNVVVKGISFFLAQLCILIIVRQLFNLRAAVFCVIAFSCSRYVLMAVGADYTDGRVMVYLLLSAASCLMASAPDQRHSRLLYVSAGICAQLMVSTALLSAVAVPFVFGMCMTQKVRATDKISPHLTAFAWMTGGFIAAFIALCFLDATLMGGDGFYLRNVVARAISFIGQNRIFVSNWENAGLWLVPSATMVPVGIISALMLMKRKGAFSMNEWRGRATLCLVLGAVLAYAIFIGLQYFKNQETLSNGFYLNFLLPFAFILCGAVICPLTQNLRPGVYWAIIAGFAVVSVQVVMGLSQPAPTLQALLPHWAESPSFAYEIAVLSCGLLAIFFCAQYPAGRLIGILAVLSTMNFFCASPLLPNQFTAYRREENFKTVLQWVAQADAQDARRAGFIWYDVYEPSGDVFIEMGAASHMWSKWGRVSEYYPLVEFKQLSLLKHDVAQNGHVPLFVFSAQEHKETVAENLIEASGLHAQLLGRKDYWSLGKAFTVYQYEVTGGRR